MFEHLKEIRNYEGLTQKEVANILGVARSTYAGWESGKDIIPFPKLIIFANYFKVSLDYLVGNTLDIEYVNSTGEIDLKTVANNLKQFRDDFNITQTKLAKTLKCSQPSIVKYESGKHLITTTYALEFSKQYNYSLDKLVGRKK